MTEPRIDSSFKPINRFFFTMTGLGMLALLLLAGIAWLLDSRLDSFEEKAAYRPPVADPAANVAGPVTDSKKHAIYVPAYSHIYVGEGRPFLLSVTLSVRNVSPSASFTLHEVNYFDSDGKLVRELLEFPMQVSPLSTKEFLIGEKDTAGGAGANFLVSWSSADATGEKPLIESVMVGTADAQGISFTSRGVEISGQ
ncbi:MAG: DUF3124 domain-containing protein [Planctomycetaceae bacterium]